MPRSTQPRRTRRRSARRRLVAAAAPAAALALLLSACSGPASSSDAGAAKDSIVVAQPSDLANADPVIDNGLYSTNIFHAVYDQLTSVDGEGALQPRLATEWTASEDAKTWTFTLRDDATFSDGTPVTAEDVRFSFQAVIDAPDSLNKIYTNNIASMTVVDDTHLTFELTAGDAAFTRRVYYISIVPEEYYTSVGSAGFAEAPIGSGPYTFESWTPGVSTVLAAYPDYWGGEPAIANVTVEPIADADARLNGLLSGDIDLTAITPAQVASVEGSGYTVAEGQSNQLVYLGFNETSGGPLADADLRSAISLAIDRETIIETIHDGYATVANASSVAPNVNGFDAELPDLAYDPAAAEELVASSGYDGSAITFQYPTGGNVPNSAEVAQAIASQLAEVGITVELEGVEYSSYVLLTSSKSHPGMYITQFSPSMMDASTTLNYLYGPTGYAIFSDPDVDALIVEANATVDVDARNAVIAEIWALNAERTHLANIDYTVGTYGVAPGLDWIPRADGHVDWREASWQ
ncbi:peptide/nickel transport system substrate-binding protein [Rathayibacter sp. PhB127]|uniref:ABC transporter substrate-binding protein n=1 Tax=Rathayibacter sp. PhB127 TaxID=2485176 RepID=UPI000F4C362A|nr:ABC transporter substrate-binding protein [Rathayibacter sp. PhB127]ROS28369.1 peptide/nickel transport system substrate-binding protein [Rathayibacter sp. PhB127]